MTREQNENFAQDRLGNVNRVLDDVRAQAGNDASTDSNGNPEGLVDVAGGDTGSDLVVFAVPEGAASFNVEEISAYNSGGTEDTFQILEAELDDDGNITSTTARSVPFNVGAGISRTISYEGREFAGAVAVNSNFEGTIGVGGKMDRPEELEPASEQTEAP
jgi:hypothetical protein